MIYVQKNDNDLVFAISNLTGINNSSELIQVPSFDEKYLGCLYRNGIFYRLEAIADKSVVAVGENVVISIAWKDLNGNVVSETEQVKAICNGIEQVIDMVNGVGQLNFSSLNIGTYTIAILGASGCKARITLEVR